MQTKSFFRAISLFIVAILLFCGCKSNFTATVYTFSGDTMTENVVTLSSLSPENIITALSNERVIPSTVKVQNFTKTQSDGGTHLTLDVSADFAEYLTQFEFFKQDLIMRCIANTFIINYSAVDILLTCDSKVISNSTYTYDLPLKYKVISGLSLPEPSVTDTPSPDNEPTATATPDVTVNVTPTATQNTVSNNANATAKPTPFSTPKRENGKKYVAITFDDGPHSQYTTKIVDKLKEHNAAATFFVVGNRVNAQTGAAIKYAYDNGCEIGIHGYTHKYYYNNCDDSTYNDELSKTAEVIEKYTGKAPTLMRPIGGAISKERVSSCPYSVILWNVDSEDWKHKKDGEVDTIVNNVLSTVGDGKIILMHEIYKNSYEAFCLIIDKLYDEGYEFVTVTDLIGSDNIKPGTKYYSAN